MSWNYRIVKHQPKPTGNAATEGYSSAYYAVHEVYYHRDGSGRIKCYADAEETGETLEELIGQLELKLIAAKIAADEHKHIIDAADLPKGGDE